MEAAPRPHRASTPMARHIAQSAAEAKADTLDEKASRAAVARMCVAFGALMAANYMLQAVRDAQIMFVGQASSARLLTVSTMASLVVGPFARVIAKPSLEETARMVGKLYRVFSAVLLCGVLLDMSTPTKGHSETSRAVVGLMYVVSQTLNNLAISVLWSFSADVLPGKGAVLYFSMFGAACTIGQALGSVLAQALLWYGVKVHLLLPLVVVFLELAAYFAHASSREAAADNAALARNNSEHDAHPRGGAASGASLTLAQLRMLSKSGRDKWVQAVRTLSQDSYNRWLGVYTVCYASTLSLIYLQRTTIAAASSLSVEEAASLSARISLVASAFTFALQVGFSTSALAKYLGVRLGLLAPPLVTVCGFFLLASGMFPLLPTIVSFELVRRVVAFGIAKPVRESLFAALPRESRFALKSVLDTFVYRGAMGLGATVFDHLCVADPGPAALPAHFVLVVHAALFFVWISASGFLASEHNRRTLAARS